MPAPHFIASDIHLGAVPDSTERAFVRFLEHVGAHGSALLIAGDLFDFWFEYGPVVPGKHFRVLAAIAALVDSGMPVTLLGGNHDAWGGRFLREEVGVEFHVRPVRSEIQGRSALFAHGDGLGAGDLRYRLLKAAVRSRATIAAFRAIHPEIGMRIARAASRTDTRAGTGEPGVSGRARFLSEWAAARLREEPALRYVVLGHSHVPAVEEIEPGRFYLNAGDWIHHFTYITVADEGGPALQRWTEAPSTP